MAASNDKVQALMQEIIDRGQQAFNPELDIENRKNDEAKYSELLERSSTRTLMPALTTLIQNGRVDPWLRPHLIRSLSLLPLRPKGVRQTIEFVLSIHPSTVHHAANTQQSVAETRGPSISLEALNSASRLISAPPSSLSPEEWFAGIAPQLIALLDGEGGLEMVKASAYIIGYGILGRREYGAPGAPGWNAIVVPLLGDIDPTLRKEGISTSSAHVSSSTTEIETLSIHKVITSAAKLADALRRLASLVSSHPNPGLSKRLLSPLLMPLWSLTSWKTEDGLLEEWRAPTQYLLQTLLQLSSDGTKLIKIAEHLLFQGNRDTSRVCWTYKIAPTGGIQTIEWSGEKDGLFAAHGPDLAALDAKVDAFIDLIQPSGDTANVSALFLFLCRKWLLSKNEEESSEIRITARDLEDNNDLEARVVEAKILQKMIDKLPDRLVGESAQVIELAREVLHRVIETDEDLDSDDTVAVALSLLNMVFTSASFQTKTLGEETYKSIKQSLSQIGSKSHFTVSSTARNLSLLLDFRNSNPDAEEPAPIQEDKTIEDQRTYKLAMSYLTSADSPTPVKAQGLDLLSSLIAKKSPILDIPTILILLCSILQDDEEYIYLRTIKALISLSDAHPKGVLRTLLERYLDATEEHSLDARLRTGEALLQVIERAGQTFTGDLATHIGSGLVFLASRRGHRPKTEVQQRKAAQLQQKKNQEAEEAWGGPVPDLEDTPSQEEIENEQYLAQIVGGWESKRGVEDLRIRASALSIFGAAIETNVAGLGSSLTSTAIDTSINILALEAEPEKAILRRAAILLVMSLLRALDQAHDEGRKLGFGFAGQSLDDVQRVLGYVAETDNDGLVRQHARDVGEGLETWKVKSLVPGGRLAEGGGGVLDVETELTELAGLSVNPGRATGGQGRPRIEEIE